MRLVNKQTLIASLEESVRDLTLALQIAKNPKSYASDLQNALEDFQEEVKDLTPSLEFWDCLGDYTEENLRKIIDNCQKALDVSAEILAKKQEKG